MLAQRIVRLLNGKAVTVKINYLVPAAAVALFALLGFAFQSAGLASPSTTAANNGKLAANCSSDVEVIKPVPPDISESSPKRTQTRGNTRGHRYEARQRFRRQRC